MDAKLIEEVGSRPVRGAVEHFYRAPDLPIVIDDQEAELNSEQRRVHAESVLSIFAATPRIRWRSERSLRRQTTTSRALNVDGEGWKEATEAYLELYERIYEIKDAAVERMAQNGEKPMRIISFEALFEIPQTVK
jgi:hypothetical protein